MGLLDLDSVFDILDAGRKGHVSIKQIQQFDETLHFSPLDWRQVQAGIKQVCGTSNDASFNKQQFVKIIEELQRRRTLEERLRWDFLSLDQTGNNRLPVNDALAFMKLIHADRFSLQNWKNFLSNREDPHMDVYWDEIKVVICDDPVVDVCSTDEDFRQESERLEQAKEKGNQEDFNAYLQNLDEGMSARKNHLYKEQTRRLGKRKLDRWHNEGVEAMLLDDGIDHGEHIPLSSRDFVSLGDLMEALNQKYTLLRKALFIDMLKEQFGEAMWGSMSPEEQTEAFETLQAEEKEMRSNGTLATKAMALYGAGVTHDLSLEGIMGLLGSALKSRNKEFSDLRAKLKDDGKNNIDADHIIKDHYDAELKIPTNTADMLVALADRQATETENLLARMSSKNENKLSTAQVMTEYCKLHLQTMLTQLDTTFFTTASAVGLSERTQMFKQDRYDPERARQEMLAQHRLQQRLNNSVEIPWDENEGSKIKGQGVVELQLNVIKEMAWKHALERDIMAQLVQGGQSKEAKTMAGKLSGDERNSRMASLRSERKQLRSGSGQLLKMHRAEHVRILQQGAGIYHTIRGEELAVMGQDSYDVQSNSAVLADLQQKQDQEREHVLFYMQAKKEKDLSRLHRMQRTARLEEHWDNVATVLLGTFESSEDEQPYLDALDLKFRALRGLLLTHELKLEHGVGWQRLKVKDQQKLLGRRLKDEWQLRQDGKTAEMTALLTMIPADIGSVRSLMGEDKAEFIKRIAKVLALHDDPTGVGNQVYLDESPAEKASCQNLLADLQQRYYAEQDCLIGQLRSHDARGLNQEDKWLHLVLMRIETRKAERADWFDEGAVAIGLFERSLAFLETRHPTDIKRQEALAKLRVFSRKKRVLNNVPYHPERDEFTRPEKGDILNWMEAYLKELDKKHAEEREILLRVIQDPSIEELQSVAMTQSSEELQQRLGELLVKHQKMDMEKEEAREENLSLIDEAVAIRCVLKRRLLQQNGNSELDMEVIASMILTDLQRKQDTQMAAAVARVTKMNEDDLKLNREFEINMRHWESADNVVRVLTKYEGAGGDQDLIKALEDKYDALKDKLLLDALMKQMSEADWKKLSEEERQKRLMQLRLKEKRLREQGKYDELAKLLGEGEENEARLRELMGDSRADYERRLKERLERRRKRETEGLDPEDEDEEEEEAQGGSALGDLQKRFEKEKDALLARLRGVESAYLTESQRQAALVRLRREKRQAEQAEGFEKAALLIGVAEKQQTEAIERLKSERARQEQLAQQRLQELRNKRSKRKTNENIVRSGSKIDLQEAVMLRLDERQEMERAVLAELSAMSVVKAKAELREFCKNCVGYEIQQKLEEISAKRTVLRSTPEKTKDNKNVLHEAFIVKMEGRRLHLKMDNAQPTDDHIVVSLLADLQEKHDSEAEMFILKFSQQTDDDLINVQLILVNELKHEITDNVAAVLLAEERAKESANEDILSALEAKYDTLKDKLITQALLNQYGETQWIKMSERERQAKKMEMRLEEKRLRKEGEWEQAMSLLGESAKQHDLLSKMMGESREDYEKRMKERLELRRRRLADGLSEEECDSLQLDDEAEEKSRHNILKDLQQNYDKEKDELMARLLSSEDHLSREQRRQLEKARLRRERIGAEREENFDAAALLLGMAHQQEADMERNRSKQEHLARERLNARLRQLRENKAANLLLEDVALPSNHEDKVGLIEALVVEIEMKHSNERELMMQLFEDDVVSEQMQQCTLMASDEIRVEIEVKGQLRKQWEKEGHHDPEAQKKALQTFAAFALSLGSKESGSDDEAKVTLLATLQQVQDKEKCRLLHDLEKKSVDEVRQLKMAQAADRQHRWLDNVALALMRTEEGGVGGSGEEREVVDALEKKYNTLRDKLLADALMQQVGEEQWRQLSEQERQKQLGQLKLQERQLRKEGRLDEAAALFAGLESAEQDMALKLGESQSEQKRRLAERLERNRALLKEREEKGLSVDENVVAAILDAEEEEEKKNKKKNILSELQHHYDDEKEALLALLRNQSSRTATEKQRQLELARLHREQKMLEKQEKFDSAALLLSVAEQRERSIEANMTEQREQQRELAKQRLAEKRRKKQEKEEEKGERTELDAALELNAIVKQGLVGVHESLLEQVEMKQETERNLLMELAEDVPTNQDCFQLLSSMKSMDEVLSKLETLELERKRWKKHSRLAAAKAALSEKKDALEEATRILKAKKEQNNILRKAVALRIHAEIDHVKKFNAEMSESECKEESLVTLLAALQRRHEAEVNALRDLIPDQDENGLKELRDAQKVAVKEGWLENLSVAIFAEVPSEEEDGDDVDGMVGNADEHQMEKAREELQNEFEQEKENMRKKLESSVESVDVDVVMAELEVQQRAKLQALEAAQHRQKRDCLEAKREAKFNCDYEKNAAAELLKMASKQQSSLEMQVSSEQQRLGDLMQQKLEARRQARLEKKREEESRSTEDESRSEGGDTESVGTSRPSTTDTVPSSLRMSKREKTVVDVSLSDDQKNEMYMKLVREQTVINRRLSLEHRRHEDLLMKRLQDMKDRKMSEATALIALGERQRTTVEKQRKSEQEKQLTATKERVARIRYEKTMTMKENSNKSAQKFQNLLDSSDTKDLNQDDKMALAAKKLEEKFRQEHASPRVSATLEEKEAAAERSSETDKLKFLKQKREQRKKARAAKK